MSGASVASKRGRARTGRRELWKRGRGIPRAGPDLAQAGPVHGYDSSLHRQQRLRETANSDIVVTPAGLARKPGHTRDDSCSRSGDRGLGGEQVVKASRNAIHLVTNPLRCHGAARLEEVAFPSGSSAWREVLDSAASRTFIAQELQVRGERDRVRAGRPRRQHGAAAALLHGGGHPDHRLLPADRIQALVARTANGGAEIVAFLKSGSAYYRAGRLRGGDGEAILKDKKKILPCAAYLNGQYGTKGLYVGVPVKLGRRASSRSSRSSSTPTSRPPSTSRPPRSGSWSTS